MAVRYPGKPKGGVTGGPERVCDSRKRAERFESAPLPQ